MLSNSRSHYHLHWGSGICLFWILHLNSHHHIRPSLSVPVLVPSSSHHQFSFFFLPPFYLKFILLAFSECSILRWFTSLCLCSNSCLLQRFSDNVMFYVSLLLLLSHYFYFLVTGLLASLASWWFWIFTLPRIRMLFQWQHRFVVLLPSVCFIRSLNKLFWTPTVLQEFLSMLKIQW